MEQYTIPTSQDWIPQAANAATKVALDAVVIRAYPPRTDFVDGDKYKDKAPKDTTQADAALYLSSLGTPVYSDLDISGGTYTDGDTQRTYPALRFATVLFFVNMSKSIVVTNIQGRNGSVKEYISDDDYQITIQGTIVGSQNTYPKESVDALKRVLDAPVALKVNSWYLNQLGIHSVVVKDYSLPQVAGRNNQQEFSISCLSDTPVILQIQ